MLFGEYILRCPGCRTRSQIEVELYQDDPVEGIRFCPMCGGPAREELDGNQCYYYRTIYES